MPLKAGVVQFSPMYGRVADNLDRLEQLVGDGARQGAELLVLPEMAWTGYLWRDRESVFPHCEPAGSGPGQDRMAAWSRRWNLYLVYGFPEVSGTQVFNSQGFTAPHGAPRPVYRKTHLFEPDGRWAEPGDTGYLQWDSPWGPVGSGICMDLNYPDLAQYHRLNGTALLAFSTNWVDEGADIHPYWLDCLSGTGSDGYTGPALMADRGSSEYGIGFRGQSAVLCRNEVVAALPGTDDGVLVVDLDL